MFFNASIKPKKILVATNHLNNLGGSETYTYTLIEALVELNYEVSFFSHVLGEVSEKTKKIATLISIEALKTTSFDLAIINHISCCILPIKSKRKVQICHGIFPEIEQPSPFINQWIGISDEVTDHIKNKFNYPAITIQNPININRFNIKSPSNELKTVLSLCQGEKANELLNQVCSSLGLVFKKFSKTKTSVWDIEEQIQQADLIVSLGRGVLEAMSCGKSTLVYDSRIYMDKSYMDGLVNVSNYDKFKKNNFSGRATKKEVNFAALKNELLQWNTTNGTNNRSLIEKHNEAKLIANQIVNYACRAHNSIPQLKRILLKTRIQLFLYLNQGKCVTHETGNGIWQIEGYFKKPIPNEETMTNLMKDKYGSPNWKYKMGPSIIIQNIPDKP